jgi:hypothetical protein
MCDTEPKSQHIDGGAFAFQPNPEELEVLVHHWGYRIIGAWWFGFISGVQLCDINPVYENELWEALGESKCKNIKENVFANFARTKDPELWRIFTDKSQREWGAVACGRFKNQYSDQRSLCEMFTLKAEQCGSQLGNTVYATDRKISDAD